VGTGPVGVGERVGAAVVVGVGVSAVRVAVVASRVACREHGAGVSDAVRLSCFREKCHPAFLYYRENCSECVMRP